MQTLLKAKQVAEILNISTKTVYKWSADGRLPCVRVRDTEKKLVRFKPQDIEAFIEKHYQN